MRARSRGLGGARRAAVRPPTPDPPAPGAAPPARRAARPALPASPVGHGPHLCRGVEMAEQGDGGEGERPRPVDENGLAGTGRSEKDRPQRHRDGVREDRGDVAHRLGHREELAGVRREALGVDSGRAGAVADVDRGRDRTGGEIAAPRIASLGAGGARRVDEARTAREPGVEHDALAGVGPPRDRLVTEHVREGQQGGQGVVTRPVEEDLLGVRAADPGEDRLAHHPVGRRGHRFGDVLESHRGEPADESARVEAPADRRGGLTREAVAEHQGFRSVPPLDAATSPAATSPAADSPAADSPAADPRAADPRAGRIPRALASRRRCQAASP